MSLKNYSFDNKNYRSSFIFSNTKKNIEYEIPFINAIRRIIFSNIESHAIQHESINFLKNTSIFDSDYLSHRLTYIPLNNDYLNTIDIRDLEIILNKKNEDEYMIDVLTGDFMCLYKNKEIDINKVFTNDQILFAKLKFNQEIYLTSKINKSFPAKDGEPYSVATISTYEFVEDKELLEENINNLKKEGKIVTKEDEVDYIFMNREKFYKMSDNQKPLEIKFTLETIGTYKNKDVFELAVTKLIEKLNDLNDAIDKNNEEKIIIEESKVNFDAFDFIIFDENDTLGNLIQSYLYEDNSVDFAGYYIPHPLDNKMIIRIALKDKNNKENNVKLLQKHINEIIKKYKKLLVDWKKLSPK
jgi:DNA-directed RNA polymerase subunit L